MNKKGFTLIELLAIIVVIAIIAIIVAPSVISLFETSKNKSYDILMNDIKTAGENYYQECEYGDLSDASKYGDMACSINGNTTTVSLGNLAKLGILKSSGNNNSVINPKTNESIDNCELTIKKNVDENIKVTYKIIGNNNCPEELQ